jgi:hypothetical protein
LMANRLSQGLSAQALSNSWPSMDILSGSALLRLILK